MISFCYLFRGEEMGLSKERVVKMLNGWVVLLPLIVADGAGARHIRVFRIL